MLGQARGIGLRTLLGERHGLVDLRPDHADELGVGFLVEEAPLDEIVAEPIDRVVTARLLAFGRWTVAVVVVARMRREAVRVRVDQRWPAARASALDRLADDAIDGEHVGAVDRDA